MGRDPVYVWHAARRARRAVVHVVAPALVAVGGTLLGGCGAMRAHLPPFGTNLLPPVVPYAADTLTVSGRHLHHLTAERFDLYAESPEVIPVVDAHLRSAAQQFARHFGCVPRVAVLVFNAPADPQREFDFTPWIRRGTQVLAFVRDRGAERHPTRLGLDEALLDSRLAELLLAAYADSVVAVRTGVRDADAQRRAVERLPHWFAEAVITRVSRPESVEQGLRYVQANRVRLMPLERLFGMARGGGAAPTWAELALRVRTGPSLPAITSRATGGGASPALVAAYSTAFGQFLVDRYGPTFLQAVADELLAGWPTGEALVSLPGVPADPHVLEQDWKAWLGAQR